MLQFVDSDRRLYAPKIVVYDELGQMLGSIQNYLDFDPDAESQDAYHLAVMNGDE